METRQRLSPQEIAILRAYLTRVADAVGPFGTIEVKRHELDALVATAEREQAALVHITSSQPRGGTQCLAEVEQILKGEYVEEARG